MPQSGVVSRLAYENPGGNDGDGQLVFVRNILDPSSQTNVVAKGLTRVTSTTPRNIFEQTGPDTLRIAYRITKPSTGGQYPSEVDMGIRLRNSGD